MRKLTLLISMLFLSLGMAWAQTATLESSTSVEYPEYRYRIKSGNNFWMAANTAPTQNNIASFAFFAVSGDFYKIYSYDKGQWVSYDKSNGSSSCRDFVKFAASQGEANAWKITTATLKNQTVYQIQPQNNDGTVSNRYMNWNGGVGANGYYSYDDAKTVGIWSDSGSADGGSAWILVDNNESVSEVADFENGAIYTFVTARGWMGSNTTANVISSAYGYNNIPAADVKRTNPNFQWTVYKSANNKYYLYNIGKGQFMGMQTESNQPIPFAETPAGLKMTFKQSGNANYPIMFSIDNVGVVNHSTDRQYGLIYWNGGWNNLNDEGSNHKIVRVGELDAATLSAIEASVTQYEETAILKMPEAGKYYRIMAVEGWNDDARYLGSKNSVNTSRAEYVANADAYTIFYFDGNYLKSYATGNYLVSNSNFLGYNGVQTEGSKIGFQEDTYVAGVYNISFNDGDRWLYVHQNNYTDAGSETSNSNGYRFNIEEVTNLPVAQSGNTVYYSLADAKANVKAGETLTLFVDTDETIELPFGVTLDKNGHSADKVTVAPRFNGEGTAASPYIINNKEMLVALRDAVNGGETFEGKYFKLTSDIALNGEWTTIGNGSRNGTGYTGNAFKGVFDGDGKTISGLTISSTSGAKAAIGLFGVVDGGTVKNVNLTDVNVNVVSSDLAGAAIGMMLNGATAEGITVSGAVVGHDGVGGIVGRLIIDGTIANCTNNASVTSNYGGIGGIVGKAYYDDASNTSTFATIANCTNNGTITAPQYVGGIAGLARANVNGCVNNGAIVGGIHTGGIIGQLMAAGTVSSNENKAKVSGTAQVGGIIGSYSQSSDYHYNNVTIANNINRGELAATSQCAAILGVNNIDGFTAMTATGNQSFYFTQGLELFGNPEDMVIDATNKFVIPVAQVGEDTFYTFADAAAAAAQDGGEIKLLANIEGGITVPANVTLNGNGFAISGGILAEGDITFAGVTKAADFDAKVTNTVVNIPAGASLQLTGGDRLVIGHGATFNITGQIAQNAAKTTDKASLVPSLKIAAGASITGNGVTFNVNNAYIVAEKYCSSKNSNANGTFNFNINNSIWDQTGNLQFSLPTNGMDPTVNFSLANSVLTTTGHLVFSVTKGEVVIDNSKVNEGVYRQLENRSTMTVKEGSVVYATVNTNENSINSGTIIVDNATYMAKGNLTGATVGTGNLVIKKGANIVVDGSITNTNITVNAEGMVAGNEVNLTANLSKFAGTLSVINNDKLEAKIVGGKVVLAAKPVAKIGEQGYATLAEALEDASAMTGDVTVDILDKVTFNQPLIGNYTSINFVGKDTDAEMFLDVQGYITATGKKVSFTDLKLSKSQGGFIANAGFMNVAFGIYDVVEVTYTNCTFENGACASSGKVTFNSCTFKKSWDKYGLWAYGNVDVTVQGSTFADYRGIKMYAENGADASVEKANLTVKNTNFSAVDNKPAIVLTYGESVVLEGNTYSSTGTFELDLDGKPNGVAVTSDVAPVCKNDNGACGVLVDGKIYTTVAQAAEVASSGSTVTLLHNSAETVALPMGVTLNKNNFEAAGVTVAAPVAKIGNVEYATLTAAVEAAQPGAEIVVIADIADVTVDVTKNLTISGAVTLNNVGINANGADALTVKGLTFTGNSWINSGTAEALTVSGVTATVAPNNTTYTNSRSAFISLGRSEGQELALTLENNNITVTSSGPDAVLGWAKITAATITGNVIKGSSNGYFTNADAIKFMAIADGAEFVINNNEIYSNYNGIVFGQNTTRDNAYSVSVDGNKFLGGADHIWIEISGGNTVHATVNATSANTVNGNAFKVDDIKYHYGVIKTWSSYAGVDVVTDENGKVIGGTLASFSNVESLADGYEIGEGGVVVKKAAATINGVKYATLGEALAALKDGETLVITSDITPDANAFIELNGKINVTLAAAEGVVINGNIQVGYHPSHTDNDVDRSASTFTVDGLTVNGTLTVLSNDANLVVKNSKAAQITVKTYREGMNIALNGNTADGSMGTAANSYGMFIVPNATGYNLTVDGNTFQNVNSHAFVVQGCGDGSAVTAANSIVVTNNNFKSWGTGGKADRAAFKIWADTKYAPASSDLNGTTNAMRELVDAIAAAGNTFSSTAENTVQFDAYDATGDAEDFPAPMYAVAKIGDVEYDNLQEAINAANGGTVTLVADVTYTTVYTDNKSHWNGDLNYELSVGGNVTLDLNGHTIKTTGGSSHSYYALICVRSGSLTVVDGSEAKNGAIICSAETVAQRAYTIYNNGALVLNGGTVSNTIGNYAIESVTVSNTALTINEGATVTSTGIAVRVCSQGSAGTQTVVVNGGNLSGTYAMWVPVKNGGSDIIDMTINGGTFTGSSNAILFNTYTNGDFTTDDIAITGGTFNGNVLIGADYADDANHVALSAALAGKVISGGTFSNDVSKYVAKGYALAQNADGTYGVVEKAAPVAKIGDTEFSYIEDAIAAWTNNTTLTLLADVTLSDVIQLSSTEYHVLDLGTYTMTAASKKDAIQIVNNGRSSASYALDIKADAENPGGITATGKAVVRTTGKSGVKDRPIIRFYNGVFTGTNVIYHSGSNGTNCPQFQFHGGVFNGTVYANRALIQFYGGTFNGSLQMSVDSSAYALVAGGRFKQLSNLYGSALNSSKFTIGSAKGVYDREVYIDEEGYYVVAKTEPAEGIEADVAKKPGTSDYLAYSKVGTEGQLGYTNVETALKNNTTATVTVYADEVDMTGINYTGTIVIPAGETVTIANAPANLKVETTEGHFVVNNNDTYQSLPVAVKIGDNAYASIAEALVAAQNANLTEVVITIVGENTAATADKFNLYQKSIFDKVTFKQENGNKPYYFEELYTGSRTNNGKFVFDGVNIAVTANGQYILEGDVVLSNNSYIKSNAEANCFVYNAEVTVEAGSKIDGVIEDIRGGSLIIDGGKTDGTYCEEPALCDAILNVNWATSNLVLKNGAYVKVNAANEVGRLTVNGKVDVSNSKLESYQYIAVNQGAIFTLNAGSVITTKELTGAGKIIVDATGLEGSVTVINGDMANFAGTIEIVGNEYASYSITDEGLVINSSFVAELEIIDGEYGDYINDGEKTVGKLTYVRTLAAAGIWYPVFLPFDVPVEALAENFDVARINDLHTNFNEEDGSIEKMWVEYIVRKSGILAAGKPFLVRAKSSEVLDMVIELEDVKLYASSEKSTITVSSAITKVTFEGVYEATSGLVSTPSTRYMAVNANGVWDEFDGYSLNPFRVMMTLNILDEEYYISSTASLSVGARVIGEENEDGTTTIYDVYDEVAEDMIFDLQGRRVLETEKGGIYIKGGKKFIAQ